MAKASLLAFMYEIFPACARVPLHAAAAFTAATFVASVLETSLWCMPISDIWTPSATRRPATHGYCPLKMHRGYNAAAFAGHLASTLVLVALPLAVLARVRARRCRGERAFAFTMLAFGGASVAASAVAFAMLLHMEQHQASATARHLTVITGVVDQNAIFCGVCLNVIRVWRAERPRPPPPPPADAASEKRGLVIRVERRWSVHVDIVDRWGYGWKDPWEAGRDSAALADDAAMGCEMERLDSVE